MNRKNQILPNIPVLIFMVITLLNILPGCSNNSATLFRQLDASKTNIDFSNTVTENDSINPIDMEFLYNGGGVAIQDLNGDSLPDIYFTASMSANKLYLNRGNLQFEDITTPSHTDGSGKWFNGAAIIDINNDGKKDIYLCASVYKDPERRKNILYINEGNDAKGIPSFRNMAEEYGLADTGMSVQSVFIDYDKDGDLDMYLATTRLTTRNIFTFGGKPDSSTTDYDKLFRNDWDEKLGHPVFTDVSREAGIIGKGYGLGLTAGDINKDGWPDIYVTNDFISSDHLWINNRNGSFSNRVGESLKHTSQNAMGNDVVDINNDGSPDLIAVDMNPEDNYRKQKNMASTNYARYRNMKDKGYSIQYVRNTLQINQGRIVSDGDSIKEPVFSEISYYSGIDATDWSWTPSVADFDNDGKRDILITNGYPKDVTDHDYISYRKDKGFIVPRMELLKQIPEIKIPNYAFRNKGEIRFENVTAQWGLNRPSYSTGAAYGDLDRDGDLDYVVNNINEKAFVYENTSNSKQKPTANYLRLLFKGSATNPDGIGATVIAWYGKEAHLYEHYPWRGYLGTVEFAAHFGLGSLQEADSILVCWPNNRQQKLKSIRANQEIVLDIAHATDAADSPKPQLNATGLFSNISSQSKFNFLHSEYDYIDFDIQRLLPHKMSEYGPALAVADINDDGLDDMYVSGPKGIAGSFILQSPDGRFSARTMHEVKDPYQKPWEEMGSLLFDADMDGDADLYLCSGSNEFKQGDTAYADRLFINDGKGNFSEQKNALPSLQVSKDVIKAADFDKDGDLDLFIGSRMVPMEYPKPASGYLLLNESSGGQIKFTNASERIAPALKEIGMITDALWTDFDNDNDPDLLLSGEFMPISFLQNNNGNFSKIESGLSNYSGLWNSLAAIDADNDGDMDYIAGNAGLNSFYKGTTEQPFQVYADDFDKNGSYDAIPFLYLKDEKGITKQFPAFTRDDMTRQLIRVKGDFPTYKDFARASITEILREDERKKALVATANYFPTALIRNNGRGSFSLHPLPYQAQWSPVFGIVADDFNQDGHADLLLSGNDFGTETVTGQYDAMNGLVLQGNGKGDFKSLSILESGIHIPYSGKSLVKLITHNRYTVASSQNRGLMQLFSLRQNPEWVRLMADETSVLVYLKNGSIRKEEYYYGSGFLSQSARFVQINEQVSKVVISNNKGLTRTILPGNKQR